MMRRYARLLRLLVLVALCSVCAGGMHWCNYGHLPWERAPSRSFRVEALLIDEGAFPPGWSSSATGPRPPANAPLGHYNSIERTMLVFFVEGGVAHQQVHRFASVREAAREFERQRSMLLPSEEWSVPAELAYESPAADQFYVACNVKDSVPMCGAVWQYEEYFARFFTHMSPDFMTYRDLEHVLKTVDERMMLHLANE